MDTRRRAGMRRLVDVTIQQLAEGALAPALAAKALYGAGVPFDVIGRVTGAARAAAPDAGKPRSSLTAMYPPAA